MTLSVAFLWHLHQPLYRDPESGRWILPWVRLHALKDYYDMATILGEVPGIALNFNFSPCLLAQIRAYASGQAEEVLGTIAYKPANLLSREERAFLLREGFQANPRTMIEPHSRYRELFLKRGRKLEGEIEEILTRFSEQDLRDLQVWSQLAWFDPWTVSQDSDLRGLIAKEKGYDEEDKGLLGKKEQELLRKIIPTYDELYRQGRIELTTSPYYHPILPLLNNSEAAQECMPLANLPARFAFPEDALWHLEKAAETMEVLFRTRPKGLWPSEGAVNGDIVQLASRAGFEWLATDEEILRHSLPGSGKLQPRDLYAPWTMEVGDRRVAILFRDRTLSDLIGFEYSRWPAKEAAEDFVERLKGITQRLEGQVHDPLVLVALDGENAWEYYPGDGREFLLALYRTLDEMDGIQTVKISDYLHNRPEESPPRRLAKLFPGSWINHDFSTWIGSKAHNRAWNLLKGARQVLGCSGGPKEAWESLYAAEGSDWFWWYSGRHFSIHLVEFDLLFRNFLIQTYQKAGRIPPSILYEPIAQPQEARRGPDREPSEAIRPVLDGRITDYYEWQGAGRYDFRLEGAMPYPRGLLSELLYGADAENLYLCLFLPRMSPKDQKDLEVTLEALGPVPVSLPLLREGRVQNPCLGVLGKILEVAVPFQATGIGADGSLEFFLFLSLNEEKERYPEEPATIHPLEKALGETHWMA